MSDLSDQLVTGSYRLPWLLWIQLLVMLLLIILLYFFAVIFLGLDDPSTNDASSAASPPPLAAAADSGVDIPKVGDISCSIMGDAGTSTSTRRVVGREGIQEREGSFSVSGCSYHPCSFIGFAKQAFLRCLGLDTGSEDSSTNTSLLRCLGLDTRSEDSSTNGSRRKEE